jgi:hypothetical protein
MVKPIPIHPSFIFRQACATPSLCRLRADLPSSLSWPPVAGCRPALHQRRTRGGGCVAHPRSVDENVVIVRIRAGPGQGMSD